MKKPQGRLASRHHFIKTTDQLAAASALAGVAIPRVNAAEDNTIHLALIGWGGRGSGAVANATSAGGLVLGNDSGTKTRRASFAVISRRGSRRSPRSLRWR